MFFEFANRVHVVIYAAHWPAESQPPTQKFVTGVVKYLQIFPKAYYCVGGQNHPYIIIQVFHVCFSLVGQRAAYTSWNTL